MSPPRIIPSSALAAALDAYAIVCQQAARAIHPRWAVLVENAREEVLRVIAREGGNAAAEGVEVDDGPRQHIPRDLPTREGVRR